MRIAQITCCCFDLETSSLNADFGIVLCGVILPAGGEPIVFRGDKINKRWKTQRSDDSATVAAIVAELEKYDIWIAHNAARFDVPFLRTRIAKHGMPPLPGRKLLDPVMLARNKLRMSYNSLEKIAELLGCNDKTPVTGETWVRAALDGDRESMDYVVDHCVHDTLTLEKVVEALKAYSTALNTWGSGY